jgi:hypothetical protein
MRFKATKVRLVLSSLLAVLALGAVTASAAQAATEGPFYKVTGKRLASGESKEVKVKSKFVRFVDGAGTGSITCRKAASAPGAKLLGSTGTNFGSADVTLEFSECTVSGTIELGGEDDCQLEGNKFQTEPLNMELAYLTENRTGELGVFFKPESKKLPFAKYTFSKTTCPGKGDSLTGYGVGGAVEVGEKAVEAGKEPAATKVVQVKWPTNLIHREWLETAGALKEVEPGIENGTGEWTTEGTFELEVGGAEWGVFT